MSIRYPEFMLNEPIWACHGCYSSLVVIVNMLCQPKGVVWVSFGSLSGIVIALGFLPSIFSQGPTH
jgi:hypothetical protein